MASSSSFVLPDADRFPSFHSPPFTYLPSIILLFRWCSNYFEYFISIMIIFIIIIHAGRTADSPPSCQRLLFLLRVRPPASFQRGGESAGVKSIQRDKFSGRLSILWSECNEWHQITRPCSSTQRNIKNLRMEEKEGANNQKASILRSSNYTGGFWSFAWWSGEWGEEMRTVSLLLRWRGGRRELFKSASCQSVR